MWRVLAIVPAMCGYLMLGSANAQTVSCQAHSDIASLTFDIPANLASRFQILNNHTVPRTATICNCSSGGNIEYTMGVLELDGRATTVEGDDWQSGQCRRDDRVGYMNVRATSNATNSVKVLILFD